MTELSRAQVAHTLALIVDHSLRAWASRDEVQMILDHDAALRARLAQVEQVLRELVEAHEALTPAAEQEVEHDGG